VVVVDEGNRADGLPLVVAPLLLDEGVANQVANRFRAVDVTLLGDECIEALEQTFVGRDTESNYL
jgi:hypothetical protein